MSNGAQARDTLGVIEAGRLSASDLEHPDLQPLLLPPAVRFSLSRNFGFVTKTFTQFFDKDGVSSVQESIGLK